MCDKMAISAHILKIAENDPFLRLKVQMKCFFLFPNLKEQQKSGRLPFTVS